MKRICSLFFFLILIVPVTVSAGSKQQIIGLSMGTLGNPYYAAQRMAVIERCKELGLRIYSTDARDQLVKQIADVEDLLAMGIDLLILNPKDPKGLIPATLDAKAAGVPVVCLDSAIDPSAWYVTNIQANNRQNGISVGEWLGRKIGRQQLKIALLSGVQGNPVGRERRLGFFSGLIEYQLRSLGRVNIEVVVHGWGNWNNLGGMKAMEDMLVAHPDINVLVSENDDMALGALEAIRESGKMKQIRIVAVSDGQKEAVRLIREGLYDVTGLNSPVLTGRMAVDIGYKVLKGETGFPKTVYTESVVITKKNADKHYDPQAIF